jgi:hypothetical protein
MNITHSYWVPPINNFNAYPINKSTNILKHDNADTNCAVIQTCLQVSAINPVLQGYKQILLLQFQLTIAAVMM